jgi:hypothetical protein
MPAIIKSNKIRFCEENQTKEESFCLEESSNEKFVPFFSARSVDHFRKNPLLMNQ